MDLHGNVRKNPKLSGTIHNVFGIQVGVGITIAVRTSQPATQAIYYHRVPEFWTRTEKLDFLGTVKSASHVTWQELYPDAKQTWLTEGLHEEFNSTSFLPLGTKETKSGHFTLEAAVFKLYSLGIGTNRDNLTYSFDAQQLKDRANTFIDIYNSAVDKLKRANIDLATLIDTTDSRIKWTRQVKASLNKLHYSHFEESYIRNCLYRPFTRKKVYFDDFWIEERYKQPLFSLY